MICDKCTYRDNPDQCAMWPDVDCPGFTEKECIECNSNPCLCYTDKERFSRYEDWEDYYDD